MAKTTTWSKQLDTAISRVEALADDAADAGEIVEQLAPLRRRLDAVSSRLAARAADQKPHQRSGHADEVQWLARTAGVSKKAAKQQLDTAKRLDELPAVRDAVEQGELSQAQADLVARAAEADPSQQRRLVGAAKREDLKGLKTECDRVIAGADDDQAATYARIHKARSARFWSDADGTHHFHAQGTADDLATLKSRITAQRDLIFRDANRTGRRESSEAYDFDALMQLVARRSDTIHCDDAGEPVPEIRPPKRDVLIHIDGNPSGSLEFRLRRNSLRLSG